jgi:uncharacterized membrane protein YeaQ/YmgE (transglycosylase-associated protein family)
VPVLSGQGVAGPERAAGPTRIIALSTNSSEGRANNRREDTMSAETILIWIAIGLVAGWLASRVAGGGYGVVGDIVLGIVGAFLGGFIFRALHLRMPFSGVASTIFVAFVGAVVLLLLMRLVGRISGRGR